jgi:hypothetical protein
MASGLEHSESRRVMEAVVCTCRGIGELDITVMSLADQGFRIITVIDTHNGDYHVVAQKVALR